jgi:hypothetical protein
MKSLYLAFVLMIVPVFADAQSNPPLKEKITYDIKKVGMSAGKATLSFDTAQLDGKEVYLVDFTATAMKVNDVEKIYMDTKTFLPLKVERDVNVFGKKELITETYDAKGSVKVTKIVGGKKTEQTLKKKDPLDNIYCFIYRYRQNGKFEIGEKIRMNLPTKDVKFTVLKKDKLRIGDREHDVYFMQSVPKKYSIWFDAEMRIPVRIDGAAGFGKTSMILESYEGPEGK